MKKPRMNGWAHRSFLLRPSVQSVAYFIFLGGLRFNKSSTNAALEFFFESGTSLLPWRVI